MYIVSLRAKVAVVGGIVMLAVGLLPLAAGVAAAGPSVTPATGGTGIQSNTAATGGTGAWTTLTGPTITEGSIGEWPVGEKITLALPANFQWNQAKVAPPSVSGCDKTAGPIAYSGNDGATVTLVAKSGPAQGSLCTISFGQNLQVRPISSASSAGTGGSITLSFVDPALPTPGVYPGGAGQVSMVGSTPAPTPTPTPPPAGALSLAATSPFLNNNAINWGEYIDLKTTGTSGTKYQMQVTTDNVTWETLKDSAGSQLTFTIGSGGSYTYRYTPIRNYWYRSTAGSTTSNSPRITVRQTISLKASVASGKTISHGSTVTFTATVRPARPELQKAVVAFELFRKSGSSWVLDKTTKVTINGDGVATWTWSATASGSYHVRAQAQPTPVNANSFWSPNLSYTVN
jgi:hypothetical protein